MNAQIRLFKPHVALDIHSGMLGMLTPNGAANIDENNDPFISLKMEGKNFKITGNNYFYFKYWFDPITIK